MTNPRSTRRSCASPWSRSSASRSASVALGTAHGALDDIVAIATEKVPLLAHAPLATNPVFHVELAAADTEFRAARALLHDVAGAAWDMAVAGEPFDNVQRAGCAPLPCG